MVGGLDSAECDCVNRKEEPADGVCSSRAMVDNVSKFVLGNLFEETAGGNTTTERELDAPEVMKSAAKKLGCSSEGCVVSHPKVINFISSEIGEEAAEEHLKGVKTQLKTIGPRYGNKLLSNFKIDDVLCRWAVEFPSFFNCPFAMFDFQTVPGYRLAEIDLHKVLEGKESQDIFDGDNASENGFKPTVRKCDTFACVLNTDVSSGKGKHWVCVFADMRCSPATVEYFNSSGRPPPKQITAWMERQSSLLCSHGVDSKTVITSRITHQKSKTECGLYALYYIRSRLEGEPFSLFREKRVPDSLMQDFRKHVFSGSS